MGWHSSSCPPAACFGQSAWRCVTGQTQTRQTVGDSQESTPTCSTQRRTEKEFCLTGTKEKGGLRWLPVWLCHSKDTDLMVPPRHRQTVCDGQPVPVHLEICGATDRQTQEVSQPIQNYVLRVSRHLKFPLTEKIVISSVSDVMNKRRHLEAICPNKSGSQQHVIS